MSKERKSKFDDLTPMPFGKYKWTVMQDVPVDYLHWFWHNVTPNTDDAKQVRLYIEDSLSALKEEDTNLIWS